MEPSDLTPKMHRKMNRRLERAKRRQEQLERDLRHDNKPWWILIPEWQRMRAARGL